MSRRPHLPSPRGVSDVAEVVLWLARNRPPTLGDARLVCIDGRTGSGKSTLGTAVHELAAAEGTSALVHLDDLLDGWDGLDQVSRALEEQVLAPLRGGRAGRYRRYDWLRQEYAEEHTVDPVDLLVVEGVGSGAAAYSSSISTLVWVDAPAEIGLERSLARDGEAIRPQLLRWMEREAALFARERTQDRADVVVDGTGQADYAVVLA